MRPKERASGAIRGCFSEARLSGSGRACRAEQDSIAGPDDDDNRFVDDVSGWDFAGAIEDAADPDPDSSLAGRENDVFAVLPHSVTVLLMVLCPPL
jgi:hypothetical protein